MKLPMSDRLQEKLARDISESSLKMADSCAAAKDLILLAKDHLQNLQAATSPPTPGFSSQAPDRSEGDDDRDGVGADDSDCYPASWSEGGVRSEGSDIPNQADPD
ncbi:hypothetical protein SASPL_148545 [Salvia splendens]|uniref:Uncharacterized protein n=1 Tax=Salvia splendens TaxID=180675 RepID=A0A8X8WA11_SALSN|nr:hypothetical protein SASPL_148545 [Salvia splendens]